MHYFRNCAFSSSVPAEASNSEKPTMAFNGVRISWLHIGKKSRFGAICILRFFTGSVQISFCFLQPSYIMHSNYHPLFYRLFPCIHRKHTYHFRLLRLLSRISSIASKSVKLLLARNVSSIFFRIGQLPQSSCVPQPPSADNALLQRNKSPTRANLPSGLRALVIS